MLLAVLSSAAALLGAAQIVPYLISITSGYTKPSRASLAIFAVIDTVQFTAMLAAGAGLAAAMQGAFAVTGLLVFVVAFRLGASMTTSLDGVTLTLTALALFGWFLIGPEFAVVATTTGTICSYIALVTKMRNHPNAEAPLAYLMSGVAAVFSLVATGLVGPVSWVIYFPPFVTLSGTTTVVVLALLQRRRTGV